MGCRGAEEGEGEPSPAAVARADSPLVHTASETVAQEDTTWQGFRRPPGSGGVWGDILLARSSGLPIRMTRSARPG